MSQIGFQVQVSKGWQRDGVFLLWPCEIFLMKTQNKKLYDYFLYIHAFIIIIDNKFCVGERNRQTLFLYV